MKLRFWGAARQVTGSCYEVEACGKRIVVDCGMEQGTDVFDEQDLPENPEGIDIVLLTHAHIDHSGLLPYLYKHGFRGRIYATRATCELCDIMLKDSAHIQEFEAEWRNRKARRSGKELCEPLYTTDDAVHVMACFCACPYGTIETIEDGIRIRFVDAGHLLGSASIELWIEEKHKRKLVFSGDIGNVNKPIIRNPAYVKEADFVIMESTYGTREHGAVPDYKKNLCDILNKTFAKGGNVVIPSFAVGRTQEMLYLLREIKEEGLAKQKPDFKVYVDSPLAIEATNIFGRNMEECFDEEALALVRKGCNPIFFDGLKTTLTSQQSKEINDLAEPKVIISASGMCEAGRIKHHLKHNLWRAESTILFVGYQAQGTLGRRLLEGASVVKLFGEPIEVKAGILSFEGISGHADKSGLLKWLGAFETAPEKVFVIHGEEAACEAFAETIQTEFDYPAEAPYPDSVYDLETGICLEKGRTERERVSVKPVRKRALSVFGRLVLAGERLMKVIQNNEQGANKDLTKFANQIHALCDKWEH